jgi:hypothetical protein
LRGLGGYVWTPLRVSKALAIAMGILIDKSPQLIRFADEGSTAAEAAISSPVDVLKSGAA